jgi:hypothetical protein
MLTQRGSGAVHAAHATANRKATYNIKHATCNGQPESNIQHKTCNMQRPTGKQHTTCNAIPPSHTCHLWAGQWTHLERSGSHGCAFGGAAQGRAGHMHHATHHVQRSMQCCSAVRGCVWAQLSAHGKDARACTARTGTGVRQGALGSLPTRTFPKYIRYRRILTVSSQALRNSLQTATLCTASI